MASNLTAQVREIARVTTAVAQGDLTKTVTIEVRGEILELKNTINTMVDQLCSFADEVTRVAREVGTEGQLGGQAQVRGVSGVWRELTENVNSWPRTSPTRCATSPRWRRRSATGDLSQEDHRRGQGRDARAQEHHQHDGGSARLVRRRGDPRRLRGGHRGACSAARRRCAGVSGVWRELTENVNGMANNLTGQVRNIAEVITAIAEGDLSRKITVDAAGEILALKNTINATVDKLNRFAAEVTRVARLVGTEGTLGVQADVKDVSGIWKELTDNVNSMAQQPDQPGARHRRRDDRGGQRRPVPEDHRRGRAARSWRSRTPSTTWWSRCRRSPTR